MAAASRAVETAGTRASGLERLGFGGQLRRAAPGSAGICLGDQGFTAAVREHSCADPTAGHMLGPAVLAPGSAAVAGDTFTLTDGPRDPVAVINIPVPLKPILAPKKATSTRVLSALGLANGLFLDCYLEKKSFAVLKGKINAVSNVQRAGLCNAPCLGGGVCVCAGLSVHLLFPQLPILASKRSPRTSPWVQPGSSRISFLSDAYVCPEQF